MLEIIQYFLKICMSRIHTHLRKGRVNQCQVRGTALNIYKPKLLCINQQKSRCCVRGKAEGFPKLYLLFSPPIGILNLQLFSMTYCSPSLCYLRRVNCSGIKGCASKEALTNSFSPLPITHYIESGLVWKHMGLSFSLDIDSSSLSENPNFGCGRI